MDKRYIDALQNLAYSMLELVQEMQNKTKADESEKSSTFELFKGYGKLGGTLKVISKGINKLKDDNKKILSNQDTLLTLSKEIRDAKEKKNIFSRLSDKKDSNKLKDGVKTIVLIAAGITAIGLAFQLIGKVDFASVMALSIALPLLALAFVQVAQFKELKGKEVFTILGVMVGISAAVWLSSVFLSMVQPLNIPQMLTIIGIAATFAIVGFGVGKLAKDLEKVGIKALLFLPIALVAVSAAIVASSYILGQTQPLGGDVLSSVLMAALAISAASLIMFIPIFLYSKIGIKELLFGSLAVVLVSGAIMVSSLILSLGTYDTYPAINWALGVGLSLLLFSPAVIVLGAIAASGVGAVALILGGLAVIGLSAVIVAVAAILSTGTYSTYPSLGWAAGVGLVMMSFGLAAMLLGGFILGTLGLGGLALAAGNAAILEIAKTIVLTSFIFSKGSFKGGPTKAWAEGVGLAIGAFSPVYAMLLKSQALSIFGSKAMSGEEYANVMTSVANSIIKVADIFNKGGISTWSNAPTKEWADGVGTAIGAFAPVYAAIDESLGDKLMALFFGKEDKAANMVAAMTAIAGGIIAVAKIFGKSKVNYVGGPSESWAKGVGGSLANFSTVYAMLEDSDLEYDDIQEMSTSIVWMSSAIGKVATQFNGINFDKTIPENYTSNLKSNIEAFLDLVEMLEDSDTDFTMIDKTSNALVKLASAYDTLATSLNKLNVNIMDLQENQLASLRMVTGNIISLSIIDSDNFSKVLDKIAEKSEDLKELYKQLATQYGQVSSNASVSTIGQKPKSTSIVTPNNTNQDMAIKDLYNKLEEMNGQLKVIASNSGNLSSYVNELRSGGDVTLSH